MWPDSTIVESCITVAQTCELPGEYGDYLMTPDNLDLVPGGSGHDWLTYSPQQGEEAGSVQQHQSALHQSVHLPQHHHAKLLV